MAAADRYRLVNLALGAAAFGHALWTWRVAPVAALFVGGALIAFVAEAAVVRAGLLEHAIEPQLAGVPVSVVLVWPAVAYVCLRLALLAVPAGLGATLLAAAIGTGFDLLTDPAGVREGVWTYPDHPLSRPRLAGVPWWNFAGWALLVFVTASIPLAVGL